MSDAPSALRAPARLAALRETGLLDGAARPALDRLARMASRLLDAPVALVSLVDAERQVFVSAHGLPEPWASRRETPLSHSFCQHVVDGGEPLVVEDAREHPLVRGNLAIPDLGVVAYAGVPLAGPGGMVLGALCAIDARPRRWSPGDLETLSDLAASASAEIGLRAARAGAEDTAGRMRAVAETAAAMIGTRTLEEVRGALREACRRVVPFDAFTFAVVGEDGTWLDFLDAADAGIAVERVRLPVRGTPSERVIRERRSLVTLRADDPAAAGARLVGTGRRSESAIRTPILAGERVLGILSVQSYTPGAYRPADVEVLEAVAALAATAMLNVRARAERAAAAAALDASEARYRDLVARLPVGVYRTTPEGEILDGNPALAEMLGCDGPEVLVSGNVHTFMDAAQRQRWRERIERDGMVREVDLSNRRSDGTLLWLRDTARAVRGPGGEVLFYEGVLEDVTEEKRAEDALVRTSAYFRALTESSSDLVSVLDGASSIRYLSPSTRRVLGYDPEDSLETELLEVVHPDDLHAVVEVLTGLLREPGGARVFELRVRHADRSWRTLEALARNLLHDPAVSGVVINARDVTGRRRAEAALRQAHEELERRVLQRTLELDRANAALRESEEYFRALIENASDVTAVIDAAARVLYESPSIARVLGYAPQELLGRPLSDYLHPDDLPRALDTFSLLAAGPARVATVELRLKSAAGEWHLMEVTAKNLLDVPAVGGVVLNARDVTYRARMEEALRQSERDYRGLFENAHDAILLLDPESGCVLEANPRACEMYGLPREDFLGRSLASFSRHPGEARERLRETMRRGSTHQFETVQHRGGGEEMFLEVNAAAVEYRRRPAVLVINRDITGRKRVEEALRESEAQLRAIFDATAAGIALVDRQGRPIEANQALREMLGHPLEELRRRTLHDLSHPEDAAADALPFGELMEGERGHYQAQKRFLRRDGSVLWGHLTVSAVRDEAGEPLYAIAVVEDVTERMRLEAELRQSQKMEAVGRLAGGIAHDFNNLLMSIMAHVYVLLRDGEVGEAARWSAEEIQGATERAAGLTRQLLAFSRKQVLQPTVLDPGEVVAGMGTLLRRLIGEDVEFRTLPDPAPGTRVRADRGQLEQVIMNLVVNARDAMPRGGKLTLATRAERVDRPSPRDGATLPPGCYAVISVSDTGTGMDEATRSRVFEPFFTTKEVGKGTGLGLSTVYGIVKQSGGWIWVESEPGRGSVFEVFLPLADGPLPAALAPRDEPPACGRETLLLVEDDAAVRAPLRRILERGGYTVLEAADGEEALAVASSCAAPIDLVLSDVVMPRMGGREMARRLAAERPGVRVILMSGYTDEPGGAPGELEAGARFIQKPVPPDELVRRVREALDEP